MQVPYTSHKTGEKPQNPLVFDGDCWVYIIDDVHEYQPPASSTEADAELDTQQHWEYTVVEQLTPLDYIKRQSQEHEAYKEETTGAILAVDELACENADRLDALEAGGGV